MHNMLLRCITLSALALAATGCTELTMIGWSGEPISGSGQPAVSTAQPLLALKPIPWFEKS